MIQQIHSDQYHLSVSQSYADTIQILKVQLLRVMPSLFITAMLPVHKYLSIWRLATCYYNSTKLFCQTKFFKFRIFSILVAFCVTKELSLSCFSHY